MAGCHQQCCGRLPRLRVAAQGRTTGQKACQTRAPCTYKLPSPLWPPPTPPHPPQVGLYTATMPDSLAEVAAQWLHRPEQVRISASAASISRSVTQVGGGWELLASVLALVCRMRSAPESSRCADQGPAAQRSRDSPPGCTQQPTTPAALTPHAPPACFLVCRWCRCVRSTRRRPSCSATWSASARRPRACATRPASSSFQTGAHEAGGGCGGVGW